MAPFSSLAPHSRGIACLKTIEVVETQQDVRLLMSVQCDLENINELL